MSKVEDAWKLFFEEMGALAIVAQDGFYDFTAKDLNRITGEEPRLLTKWDTKDAVPSIFHDNKLGLLSLSATHYRIGAFNVFHDIESPSTLEISSASVPGWIRSLNESLIGRSESLLIAACYASDILKDFLEEAGELVPTVSGRLRCAKDMDFSVDSTSGRGLSQSIDVSGAQFEVDGGYESPTTLYLIEAKNRFQKNFNIRQLYYPWRYFSDIISPSKPVKSVFLMQHNDVISLYLYDFNGKSMFNSLHLLHTKRYSFCSTEITMENIENVLSAVRNVKTRGDFCEDEVFPQADDFDLVINSCMRLLSTSFNTASWVDDYEYVSRQSYYYSSAARFLGLIEKVDEKYQLTCEGKRILDAPYQKRQMGLMKMMFSVCVIKKTMEYTLKHSGPPCKKDVANWIREDGWELNDTTSLRRAQTVLSWVRWVLNTRTEV